MNFKTPKTLPKYVSTERSNVAKYSSQGQLGWLHFDWSNLDTCHHYPCPYTIHVHDLPDPVD